jgi:hypothetical protein
VCPVESTARYKYVHFPATRICSKPRLTSALSSYCWAISAGRTLQFTWIYPEDICRPQ